MYPGQFHSIKLNLFNIVLVLDLSRPASLNMITSAIAGIVSRGLPFRFGIVPLPESEDGASNLPSNSSGSLIPNTGAKMAKLFYHSVRNYGRKRTMGFLQKVGTAPHTLPLASIAEVDVRSWLVPSLASARTSSSTGPL